MATVEVGGTITTAALEVGADPRSADLHLMITADTLVLMFDGATAVTEADGSLALQGGITSPYSARTAEWRATLDRHDKYNLPFLLR